MPSVIVQSESGIIASLDERGYGFITPSSGGADVFFHARHTSKFKAMRQGDRVTFVRSRDARNKPCAVDVSRPGVIKGEGTQNP